MFTKVTFEFILHFNSEIYQKINIVKMSFIDILTCSTYFTQLAVPENKKTIVLQSKR